MNTCSTLCDGIFAPVGIAAENIQARDSKLPESLTKAAKNNAKIESP